MKVETSEVSVVAGMQSVVHFYSNQKSFTAATPKERNYAWPWRWILSTICAESLTKLFAIGLANVRNGNLLIKSTHSFCIGIEYKFLNVEVALRYLYSLSINYNYNIIYGVKSKYLIEFILS